ncbi:histidine kinase [Kibdelosporangium philippinense]|uniref:histidine kinase n=1 Tax=Kibdelosporangium philippinense TaxID=211113 RepID=A0ABS8ZWY9_9PSEU|nr:histidine kinase [Kibdelosporangium philippinense]MCE7012099.1 histidine kinase [Kibdelosporangium philippinense]
MTTRPVWRSRVWPVLGPVLGLLAIALLAVGADGPGATIVPIVIVVTAISVAIWTIVRARLQRREYEARLTAWAAAEATHHERLRIARELHDIVSHGLGMITLRATAAQRIQGDRRESERDQALEDIVHASKHAISELRRMLTVIRDADEAPLRPVQSLADIPGLVEAARSTGLAAQLSIGALGDVSPGVQATVCAIVREAIANTSRYAGPTELRIDLRRDDQTIIVTAEDDGPKTPWQPTRGAGHGLDGLRERVDALGGDLRTGQAGNGFRVTAHLPDGEVL